MSKETRTIFLCGDVMTGRGIDQILPHPCAPHLFEPYLKDARGYLSIAELKAGPIPHPADYGYPWGDALGILERIAPDLRIVNLETSVTSSEEYWKGKGINYRMHPENIPCLTRPRIDACTLANNHVLDWGYPGLEETLSVLHRAGVKTVGAGGNLEQAAAPAKLALPGQRSLYLFGLGFDSSGIPEVWRATGDRPGVNLLPDLSDATADQLAAQVRAVKREGDTVIASLHWGENWGFEVKQDQRQFAHRLIDAAGVDIVHGHSSHHVKGIEVYHGGLVIYGCGDFINDYEGIRGYEEFRGDLGLMYFVELDGATGRFARLTMVPSRMRKFRVQAATAAEAGWLAGTLNRQGKQFGTSVQLLEDGTLVLQHQ